jgi:tRNA(Arg) A34 adenosine deaminase TadA
VTPAAAAFASLDLPWRLAFDAAWEAMNAGSVPVGAVLTAPDGAVISVGRSQASLEEPLSPGRLSRTTIAHAEINALAAVPSGRHEPMTAWSTLEPCLLCTGALVVSRISAVHFGGADPLWAGLEQLPAINSFIAGRWPRRSGPRTDEFGVLGTLLPLLYFRERYPDGPTVASHRVAAPAIAALADDLLDSDERRSWASATLEVSVERLWTRLGRCGRHA